MPGALFLRVNQTVSTECTMQKCICLQYLRRLIKYMPFRILKHLNFFACSLVSFVIHPTSQYAFVLCYQCNSEGSFYVNLFPCFLS